MVFISRITKTSRHVSGLTGISRARERRYSGADRASLTHCTLQPSGCSPARRASGAAPYTWFPQGPVRLPCLPERRVLQLSAALSRPPTLLSQAPSSTGITLFSPKAPYSVVQRLYPATS